MSQACSWISPPSTTTSPDSERHCEEPRGEPPRARSGAAPSGRRARTPRGRARGPPPPGPPGWRHGGPRPARRLVRWGRRRRCRPVRRGTPTCRRRPPGRHGAAAASPARRRRRGARSRSRRAGAAEAPPRCRTGSWSHPVGRASRPAQRCRQVGELAQQRPGVARVDDLLDQEGLGGPEGRADLVQPRLDLAGGGRQGRRTPPAGPCTPPRGRPRRAGCPSRPTARRSGRAASRRSCGRRRPRRTPCG